MKFHPLSFGFIILIICSVPLQAQKTRTANETVYKVVINHEEQYSILLDSTKSPGWKAVGKKGSLSDCQQYIEKVWTDMRPLSIRKQNLSSRTIYGVVVNHEEQYSIWPKEERAPRGWKFTGKSGSLQQCNDYIAGVWTDMRPLSLQKHIKDLESQDK